MLTEKVAKYRILRDSTSVNYPFYVADPEGRWLYVGKGGSDKSGSDCQRWIAERSIRGGE